MPPQEIRMKKIISLAFLMIVAAVLFSIGFAGESSSAADSSNITIAYSTNILGYMEPCG